MDILLVPSLVDIEQAIAHRVEFYHSFLVLLTVLCFASYRILSLRTSNGCSERDSF